MSENKLKTASKAATPSVDYLFKGVHLFWSWNGHCFSDLSEAGKESLKKNHSLQGDVELGRKSFFFEAIVYTETGNHLTCKSRWERDLVMVLAFMDPAQPQFR